MTHDDTVKVGIGSMVAVLIIGLARLASLTAMVIAVGIYCVAFAVFMATHRQ